MKHLTSFCIITFFLFALNSGCTTKKQLGKGLPKAIKFTYHADLFFIKSHELYILIDSILYYYSNGLVLCKLPVPYYDFYWEYDREGNAKADSIKSITPGFKYLVYRQGKNNALLFNKDSAILGRNISADSAIKQRTNYSSSMFNTPNDSLVEVKSERNIMVEKYVPKIKINDTFADSVYLNYSPELKGIPFSLSSRLDSLHIWKLFKCQLIYNKIPATNKNAQIPRRELYFEIVPYSPEDEEYADFLFKKFIEEEKK